MMPHQTQTRRRFLQFGVLGMSSGLLAACGASQGGATAQSAASTAATSVATQTPASVAASTVSTATTSVAATSAVSAAATSVATASTAATVSTIVSAAASVKGAGAAVNVMQFWGGPDATAFQTILDGYGKEHPGVTVTMTTATGDVDTKLATLVSGGDPPDLSHIYGQDIGSFAHRGVPQKLAGYMNRSKFDINALVPAQVAMGSLDGQVYALPWTSNVYGLVWDKGLFSQSGLDPNAAPTTIEDLTSVSAKLTKESNGAYSQLGVLPVYPWSLIDLWTAVFGGKTYDEQTGKLTANNPGTLKALQWEQQLYKQLGYDKVNAAIKQWQGEWNTKVSGSGDAPFELEKLGFYVIGEWEPGGIDKAVAAHAIPQMDYGAAPVPYPADQPNLAGTSILLNSNMWCLPTGAKNADGGWDVLAWLETPGPTLQVVEAIQNLPPLLNLDLGKIPTEHPQFAEFIKIAQSPKLQYRPVLPISSEFWSAVSKVESDVIAGKVDDIAGALGQVDSTMQPKLDAALKG